VKDVRRGVLHRIDDWSVEYVWKRIRATLYALRR